MSELNQQASIEQPENESGRALEGALDAMGNHPAKMIALLVMARSPEQSFTGSQLFRAMSKAQGLEPGWITNYSIPEKYCRDSLEPIGLLIEGKQKSRKGTTVSNYSISQTGRQIGIPLAGALLDWELEQPELSLQEILGGTNSTTRESRNPSLRVKLLSELLSSPEALPPSRLTERLEDTKGRMEQIFHRLAELGIIEIEENSFENREITVDRPDMEAMSRAHVVIRPEIIALYGVAKQLAVEGVYKTNAQEVVEKALEFDSNLNGRLVWNSLVTAVSQGRMPFYNIYHFSDNHYDKTLLRIGSAYADAIKDLIDRLNGFSDETFRFEARKRAFEIINNAELVSLLMNKARVHSSAANAMELSEWRALVIQHLPEDGADARSLYNKVSSVTARKISYVAFRKLLNDMSSDSLEIDETPVRGKFGRPISFIKPV